MDDGTTFRCPLCGTTDRDRVVVTRPDGSLYATDFWQCHGCSVMFRDPVRFTECRKRVRGDQFAPGRLYRGREEPDR